MALTRIKGDAGDKLLDELQEEQRGQRKAIRWPMLHMDKMFGGIRPGEMTVLSGTEGSGKSYLALALLLHCQREGLNWYYLPMEETPKYWLRRFLAIIDCNWSILEIEQGSADRKLSSLQRHKEIVSDISGRIFENPRTPIDVNGAVYMPEVPWRQMAEEICKAAQFADILVIDPVTMIDFKMGGYDENDRRIRENEFDGQSDFVRYIVANTSNTNCHLIVVSHSTKDGQNIQGHSDWTRFSQNSIRMVCHEEYESDVMQLSKISNDIMLETFSHSRTIHIHKTRNGQGSRRSIAIDFKKTGPVILEHGVITKTKAPKR